MTGADLPGLGRHSPRLKALRHLDTPSGRIQAGRYLVEGVRVVGEALAAGHQLEWLLVAEGGAPAAEALARRARDLGVEVWSLDAQVLERLSPTRSSQGLLGVARLPSWSLRDTLGRDLVVVLEGVQDPGNVGTLVRTARAAGAGGAILVGGADPFSPRAVRSAAGTLFQFPVVRLQPERTPEVLAGLESGGHALVTAEAHGGQDLYASTLPPRLALVMGAEVQGIPSPYRDRARLRVSIPLAPGCESLNVAAAAAVLLFEFRRRSLAGCIAPP